MRRFLTASAIVAVLATAGACVGDQGQTTPPATPTATPKPTPEAAPAEAPKPSVPEATPTQAPAPKPQAPDAGDQTPATSTGTASHFGPEKSSLGIVRVTKTVTADGEPLSPGTYAVKLTGQAVTPVLGESKLAEQWVEFSQNGAVKGREIASVVSPADVAKVAKGGTPPAGTYRVDTLKGGDYLRVWINRDGTQYLIHLTVAAK